MKSTSFAAGLLFTAALSAATSFAGTNDLNNGTLTREAVLAEYMAANKNGTLPPDGDRAYRFAIPNSPSTLTREAVRAEYMTAKKNGTLPPDGDRAYRFAFPNTVRTLTREAVLAEYIAAKNSGALQVIHE